MDPLRGPPPWTRSMDRVHGPGPSKYGPGACSMLTEHTTAQISQAQISALQHKYHKHKYQQSRTDLSMVYCKQTPSDWQLI